MIKFDVRTYRRRKLWKSTRNRMLKEFSDANATSGFEEEFVKLLLAIQKDSQY